MGGDLGQTMTKRLLLQCHWCLIGSAVGTEIGSKLTKKELRANHSIYNEKIISIVQEVSDKYSFFEGQRVKS